LARIASRRWVTVCVLPRKSLKGTV
jgi:hypothetical protein